MKAPKRWNLSNLNLAHCNSYSTELVSENHVITSVQKGNSNADHSGLHRHVTNFVQSLCFKSITFMTSIPGSCDMILLSYQNLGNQKHCKR